MKLITHYMGAYSGRIALSIFIKFLGSVTELAIPYILAHLMGEVVPLRGGALVPLNREHAYRSELALNAVNGAGTIQEALTHQKAGGLTSFLGMGRLKHLDLPAQSLRLQSGDRLILMSDGVYNALTEEELCSALGLPAEQAAEALRRRIQEKNYPTQDNYTAILLEMRPSGQA